jgi:AraC family transcriptional regulator
MNVRIEILPPKHLAGMRMRMSLVNNRTRELFQAFMPHRHKIANTVDSDIFCVRVYDASYSFSSFDPTAEFEKWAAVEVSGPDSVPNGMETLDLAGGSYAVFEHKGGPAAAPQSFGFIFGTWLPSSNHMLDHRPHFEIIGEKYGDGGSDSEEEIWVPVKPRN